MCEEDGHVMVLSTPEQQMLHMNLFMHEEHPIDDRILARLNRAVNKILEGIEPVDPDWTMDSAIRGVSTTDDTCNWESHPGPELRSRNFRTKADAWPRVMEETVRRVSDVQTSSRRPYLSATGGRAKLSTLEKYERKTRAGEPVGRFIRMVDLRDVVICGVAKSALEEQNDWSNFGTALGESYFHNGGRRYAEYFGYTANPCIWGCGLDLKKCDAHFPLKLSEMIFDKLFSRFTEAQLPLSVRDYIKAVHCNGSVIGADRNVYNISHGLCSGAPFTSLIESIGVQALTFVAIAELEGTLESVMESIRIKTLGDDQWFTYPREVGQAELGPQYLLLYGLEIGETPEGRGLAHYEFLGKFLTEDFRPYRPETVTYYQLRFPERPIESASQSLARAVGHLIDNFCNLSARHVVREYILLLKSFYPGLAYTAADLAPFLREDGMYQLFQARTQIQFVSVPTDAEIEELYFGDSPGVGAV
jgi:hypothetical protein